MIKLLNSQKGFTVVEALLIILILVVIGGAGYIVYTKHHKTTTSPSTSVSNTNNVSTSSQWLAYTSSNGNFSAYFPTSPNFQKTPASPNPVNQTINGVNVVLSSVVSSNNINTTYTINSLTYPNNAILPSVSNSFPSYQQKHIISSKSTSIGGKSAETYVLTATRKPQIVNLQGRQSTIPATKIFDTGEFIVDGKILYELDAIHYGNTPALNTQYFLNSFKLNN